MMTQAFYTGISGIKTNSTGIDIVSDNMANIDTIGFRGNDYEFSSLFENMLSTDTLGTPSNSSIGVGSQLQASPMVQQKGSFMISDKSTDLALFEDGWFGIKGNGNTLYTRDGNFTFDKDDDLVTQDGFHVLGTMGNNISDNDVLIEQLPEVKLKDVVEQEPLRFPKSLTFPPEATSNAKFIGNLGTEPFTRTMSASVVDPQNNKNDLRLEFSLSQIQTPPGTQWDVVAKTQSLDGTKLYDTQTGQVSFDASGALISNTLTTIDNNGAPVSIDLGNNFDGVVSISNVPISASSTADGTIGGDLQGYDINKNGEVIATFTNGMQSSVGKIAVYHFQNDQGLNRISGTRFQESTNSGKALFFKDEKGENIIGTNMANFKLEGSNIEMSYGLTELIILQRAYDANSKSVTTADQMMQKALNMDA
ncbi:flagellar hook protein FlgE [Sulfurimonas autotrophica]|uniref:Flagellar hook-basal body protein n=1 Tax=Sulfurimonas autotrophica (strain ATCC BAA-671 / DSM 16294 / JCM 11897 / OK10) TaxID=563040 RepID=E0USR4_SULAO|nr:flagellar hook-basal body complex protein [Sulfurimonas autotrophica]ADN08091.1 flagellar hook-basal body protein [Sulfurimonas autotrophica DSM 16294]